MGKIISLLVVLFLLNGFLAMGAGSSTGSNKKSDDITLHEEVSAAEMTPPPKKSCEGYSGMQARIKCRLDEKNTEAVTEESCRVALDRQECANLYKAVKPCYTMLGIEKNKCFKTIAKFTHSTIPDQGAEKEKDPIKKYLIFLLYDLQERVEDSHRGGKIDSESAASIITSIVEIKQAIFLDKSQQEIESRLRYLKDQWERYM